MYLYSKNILGNRMTLASPGLINLGKSIFFGVIGNVIYNYFSQHYTINMWFIFTLVSWYVREGNGNPL